jgi:hypothetical protein
VERLTHFNDYPALKAPNPAVNDNGGYMAFQIVKVGGQARVGRGIFLYERDLPSSSTTRA